MKTVSNAIKLNVRNVYLGSILAKELAREAVLLEQLPEMVNA
jgi:hypothetical protein